MFLGQEVVQNLDQEVTPVVGQGHLLGLVQFRGEDPEVKEAPLHQGIERDIVQKISKGKIIEKRSKVLRKKNS